MLNHKEDEAAWLACRASGFVQQGKLTRMQIPMRSIYTGYLRRCAALRHSPTHHIFYFDFIS